MSVNCPGGGFGGPGSGLGGPGGGFRTGRRSGDPLLLPVQKYYAHIEVLVTFLLVNFFVFLVITRDHGRFEGRH